MMRLEDILDSAYEKLSSRFSFSEVALKHPLPEYPLRMLGLLKIDGRVMSADKFTRVLLLSSSILSLRGSRSIFLSPRPELDLPIFSTEVILLGKHRGFLVDIQSRGGYDRTDTRDLYEQLIAIRDNYPDLLVRVSGYTAYFSDLNPTMQGEIITRAEYDLETGREVIYT